MDRGKQIEVNKASLVDLKAELFRRKAEFDREKTDTGGRVIRKPLKNYPKPEAKNKGVAERSLRDQQQHAVEAKTLAASRDKLEEKARIYDRMQRERREGDGSESSGEDNPYLVDFQRKAWAESDESSDTDQEEKELRDVQAYAAAGEGDEWVEYVDDLGRTRKCLRKDLPKMVERDRSMPKRSPSPTQFFAEREAKRRQWEEEERERLSKPVGPVFFQEVFGKEIRQLGVGYFGFSLDPNERAKQMADLNAIRQQTSTMRERRQRQKQKQKEALGARLQKVRERKEKREAQRKALEKGGSIEKEEGGGVEEVAGKEEMPDVDAILARVLG